MEVGGSGGADSGVPGQMGRGQEGRSRGGSGDGADSCHNKFAEASARGKPRQEVG